MAKLGSYEWGEQTGGILRPADKVRLATGVVQAQVIDSTTRLAKWLGAYRPNTSRLNIDKLGVPNSAARHRADDFAGQHYTQPLLLHCLRTYYFAGLWSQFYDLRVDQEVLYISCLLHDVGLTSAFHERSGCCGFGIVSAREATRFVAAMGWTQARQREVYEAISYHLNPYLSIAAHEPEAVCLQRAAHLDVVGAGRHLLPAAIVARVHQLCPRDGFCDEIVATITGLAHAPSSRADLLGKMGFAKLAQQNPLDRLK